MVTQIDFNTLQFLLVETKQLEWESMSKAALKHNCDHVLKGQLTAK